MSNQRGRKTATTKEQAREQSKAQVDLRRFVGKQQKTDFSFLKNADPKRFGDKVFRLVTDDESHANVADKTYLGWEVVQIKKTDEKQNPLIERFLFDKEVGESATIRIPVNRHNPQMGIYGILMMKSEESFKREERAALNEEVRRTEVGLRRGQEQADTGAGDAFYAPNVDEHGTRGFKQETKDSLI